MIGAIETVFAGVVLAMTYLIVTRASESPAQEAADNDQGTTQLYFSQMTNANNILQTGIAGTNVASLAGVPSAPRLPDKNVKDPSRYAISAIASMRAAQKAMDSKYQEALTSRLDDAGRQPSQPESLIRVEAKGPLLQKVPGSRLIGVPTQPVHG